VLAKLVLKDGSVFQGEAFGSATPKSGEVVFNTGMVGYPECFTDPSYAGQIINLTYPLIGNYGVSLFDSNNSPIDSAFESQHIQIEGLIVSEFSRDFSHWDARTNLNDWLRDNDIPAISGIDTRLLTQKLRECGSMLGKIVQVESPDIDFVDPNLSNLVARVSPKVPETFGDGGRKVLLLNCGCKFNIIRSLLQRDVTVKSVPWDWDLSKENFDGVLLSNGPGDPTKCEKAVESVRKLMQMNAPIFGICLGNQLLARAAGAQTYKLKYGHRGQNQPCILVGSKRCFITSQNHGYAVDDKSLPDGWQPWFFNANDGTNEGIRHCSKPFCGVQFHPEASPGPLDASFLFDDFVEKL